MTKPARRRDLKFEQLDDVVFETRRLLEKGYRPRGNWNLAQAAGHLDRWMRFVMDGYPASPWPLRPLQWLVRQTVGRWFLRRILSQQRMPTGAPTLRKTVPDPDEATDREAIERLEETVQRLNDYAGPVHPSPLFGQMNRDQAVKLQMIHAAHHLSFLEPLGEGEAIAGNGGAGGGEDETASR